MLYFILFLALLALTVKGYSGKRVSTYVRDAADTYAFNLLRMCFCVIIGLCMVFFENSQEFLFPEVKMLAICLLSGISNASFLVFWMLAIRVNSMVSVDVGLTLGSLIPSVLCLVLFGEEFSLLKMLGFAVILASTFILSGGGSNDKKKKLSGILLLILAAVGDGMSGFSQQLYRQYYTASGSISGDMYYPKTVFHLYTYVFAAIVLFAVLIGYRIFMRKEIKDVTSGSSEIRKRALTARAVIHIFIMAVCLFAANYLQTVATSDYNLSSQIMYPVIRGGCLVTVNIVAMIFFGERITRRSIVGSLVAVLGILIMSVI